MGLQKFSLVEATHFAQIRSAAGLQTIKLQIIQSTTPGRSKPVSATRRVSATPPALGGAAAIKRR